MPNEKPNVSDDLLARAIRRVHREQVEGKDDSSCDADDVAKHDEQQDYKR